MGIGRIDGGGRLRLGLSGRTFAGRPQGKSPAL